MWTVADFDPPENQTYFSMKPPKPKQNQNQLEIVPKPNPKQIQKPKALKRSHYFGSNGLRSFAAKINVSKSYPLFNNPYL